MSFRGDLRRWWSSRYCIHPTCTSSITEDLRMSVCVDVDVPWRPEDVVRCSACCAVLELPGISGTVGAESMLCGSKVCTLSTGSRSHRSFWELGTLRSATNPYRTPRGMVFGTTICGRYSARRGASPQETMKSWLGRWKSLSQRISHRGRAT